MSKQITIPFQVTGWDVTPYDEKPGSPTLSRVAVKKTFDCELKGESTAQLLMCASEDGSAGYTVMERVEGCLCGRAGSFVMIHGATHTPQETSRALGFIMPNSGTGELEGISGTVEFKTDEKGKNIILDFVLEDNI
jgi:hypothetical protein